MTLGVGSLASKQTVSLGFRVEMAVGLARLGFRVVCKVGEIESAEYAKQYPKAIRLATPGHKTVGLGFRV